MNNYFILIVLSLINLPFVAQNLVNNGSFEEYEKCPKSLQAKPIHNALFWNQIGIGTSDHFSSCSKKCGVPKNFIGIQDAKDGNSYIGIIFYNGTKDGYQEAVQTKLKEPLEKGKYYYVEYSYSLAEKSRYMIEEVDYFIGDSVTSFHQHTVSQFESAKERKVNIDDLKQKWITKNFVYQAKGGEQYLSFGASEKSKPPRQVAFKGKQLAYYYLDDIKLYVLDTLQKDNDTMNLYSYKEDTLFSPSLDDILQHLKKSYNNLSNDVFVELTTNQQYLLTDLKKALKTDKTMNFLKVNYHLKPEDELDGKVIVRIFNQNNNWK